MNYNVLRYFLDELFNNYAENVPQVKKITQALIEQDVIKDQSDIVNDHIAFRTLGIPNLGIASFEKIFLKHGYTKMEYYNFEQKKLNAHWYKPPSASFPRVFISELRVEELSEKAQKIIQKYTAEISKDPLDLIDLNNGEQISNFLHTPLWGLPTLEDFNVLQAESEYAAWVIFNRYYLNHYTISVHTLPEGYNNLDQFNQFLEGIGIKLNSAGGKIKESKDGLLRQSSSVSNLKTVKFVCGNEAEISGSYVEFAERCVLPEFRDLPEEDLKPEHRREGFEARNADKIFESTYTTQTKS